MLKWINQKMKTQHKVMKYSLVSIISAFIFIGCGNNNPEQQSVNASVRSEQNINIWPILNIEVKKDAQIEIKIASLRDLFHRDIAALRLDNNEKPDRKRSS